MTAGALISLIAGVVFLWLAVGIIKKMIGLLLVLTGICLFLYQKNIWPFETNLTAIDAMEEKYCKGQDEVTCQCIVKPLKKDIKARFTKPELDKLNGDKLAMLYVLNKSIDAIESEITNCLGETDSQDKLKQFKKELLTENIQILGKVNKWMQEGKDILQQKFSELKGRKSELDEKYDQ